MSWNTFSVKKSFYNTRRFLKKQFNTRECLLAQASGGFMFVVLYLYNAFNIQAGFSYSGHSLLFRAISFGGVTFFSIAILEWLIRPRLIIDTRDKRVIWYSVEILITAHLVYLLFNYFWAWSEWYWMSYGLMMVEVPMVLVIPNIAVTWLFKSEGATLNLMVLKGEGGKMALAIKPEDLLIIKAEENYLNIHHLVNGQVEKQLIRKTMKEVLQEMLDIPAIVRCHRSYLINSAKVLRVIRTPKKLELDMGHDLVIPVLRRIKRNCCSLWMLDCCQVICIYIKLLLVNDKIDFPEEAE